MNRLGVDYSLMKYEALLKNLPLQIKTLARSCFFLGACQLDLRNKVQHFKYTNVTGPQ